MVSREPPCPLRSYLGYSLERTQVAGSMKQRVDVSKLLRLCGTLVAMEASHRWATDTCA